jgi:hypothetical protein
MFALLVSMVVHASGLSFSMANCDLDFSSNYLGDSLLPYWAKTFPNGSATMNRSAIRKLMLFITMASLLVLIVFDSIVHFDSERVQRKKHSKSDQRHWSLFYSQRNVYLNSSLRYSQELIEISKLLEAKTVVLTDFASGYYIAAESAAFVKGIHAHHGGSRQPEWHRFLRRQDACFPDKPDRKDRFITFVRNQNTLAKQSGHPPLKYIMVNSDKRNRNLRRDCLAARSGTLNKEYSMFLELLYRGDHLSLYSLDNIL